MAGSSVEIEQTAPAATSWGSGCSSSDETARVRRFEIGQTSRTIRAGSDLAQEPGILDGADAVAQSVGAERFERSAHGCGPGHLARVGYRGESQVARQGEGGLVGLGRILGLHSAETDAENAAVAVFGGVADGPHAPRRAGSRG